MTPEQLKKFIDDFEDDDKLFEHDKAVSGLLVPRDGSSVSRFQALLDLWNKMICHHDKP